MTMMKDCLNHPLVRKDGRQRGIITPTSSPRPDLKTPVGRQRMASDEGTPRRTTKHDSPREEDGEILNEEVGSSAEKVDKNASPVIIPD